MPFQRGHKVNKGKIPWNKGNKTPIKMIFLICNFCNKRFEVQSYRKNRAKYCSCDCYYKSEEGKTIWNKGKKLPQYSGENHPRWKGGRIEKKKGYINIYQPQHPSCYDNRYVAEHRLIIEKHIGRYLLPTEEVHHLGHKDDNRLEMLMAFVSNSAHKRFEHNPDNVKPEEIIFDGRFPK